MSRADEMRALLERWECSGLTQRAFAEREGVGFSKLVYWRRRLREMDEEEAERAPAAFAPVRVVGLERAQATGFELTIDGRLALSVPESFDAEELRRLVGILKTC